MFSFIDFALPHLFNLLVAAVIALGSLGIIALIHQLIELVEEILGVSRD